MKPEKPEKKVGTKETDIEYVEVPAYEALAGIYDHVMSHVDYLLWAEFAMEILTDHGMPSLFNEQPPHLLECGCGTGTLACIVAANGYIVDAFDKSTVMIEMARSKARGSVTPPRFSVSDFLHLEVKDRYDAVLCLYDSVNYLTEPRQVEDFFRRVKSALKPNALFLFDVCTEYNSKRYFSSLDEKEYGAGFSYHRLTNYNADDMIQENIFMISTDNEPGKVFIDRHFQKIYHLDTLRHILSGLKMLILEETDGVLRESPHEESIRVHFLSRNET